MKTFTRAAIRCSLIFTAVAALLAQPAQAYTVTLQQVGFNVVATGSGALNVNGLLFQGTKPQPGAQMIPTVGTITTGGQGGGDFADMYSFLGGPDNFGSGGGEHASTESGDFVGVELFDQPTGIRFLLVPEGYVSGNPLSDNATYANATFASLGVTPGTYVWSWGPGANQRFTLIIGVPDGGSTVSLLGFGLLGLATLRRRLRC